MPYKLLVETPAPTEEYEIIYEEKDRNSPASMFIRGPYMMAEGVNRNKRLYPLEEMVREVDRYKKEMIVERRAMGELNHPTTADVNLERACHLVTEMWQDGNVFYGKSKILTTPCGLIVRSLINDGVKVGMSSRALGQLVEEGSYSKVKEMRLVAIDCVADPSFSKAFVNGILESKQWVLAADGTFEESYDRFEKSIKKLPKRDLDVFLREHIIKFIHSIKY